MLNCLLFWRMSRLSAGQLLGPDLAEGEMPPRAPRLSSSRKYSAGDGEGDGVGIVTTHTPLASSAPCVVASIQLLCDLSEPGRQANQGAGQAGKGWETRSVPQMPATGLVLTQRRQRARDICQF